MKSNQLLPKPVIRNRPRQILLFSLLLVLVVVAGWVYTAPVRREATLAGASFSQLVEMSRREKDDARVFYHLGVRLRQTGHDGPALAALERAGTLAPDDEQIWIAWAATAGSFRGDNEAFGILTSFVTRHPKSAHAHLALAFLYQQEQAEQRSYEEALAAAKLDPKFSTAWRLTGAMGLRLRRYAESEAAFRRAIALAPEDWRTVLGLGDALRAQHKYGEAVPFLRTAARLAPTEAAPALTLGRTLLTEASSADSIHAAVVELERAVTLAPDSAEVQAATAEGYIRENDYAKARTALLAAERVSPSTPVVHYQLNRVLLKLGDTAGAAREKNLHEQTLARETTRLNLASAVWQHPKDATARLKFARFLTANNDPKAAIEAYHRLLLLDPKSKVAQDELAALEKKNPALLAQNVALPMPEDASLGGVPTDALLRDADAMLAKGRFPEAEKTFGIAAGRDPNSARAFEGMGLALEGQGKREESFRLLNHALTLNPNLPEAGFTIARFYFDAGFPDEAVRRMQVVLKVQPKRAENWHALGLALAVMGTEFRAEEAVEAFAHASRLDPTNIIYLRDQANSETVTHQFMPAEAHYRQALKLDPNEPISQQLLGSFLIEHEPTAARQQEAQMLLTQSLKKFPDNPSAQLSMGTSLLLQGKAKAAVVYLENSIEAAPKVDIAWYRLSRAYALLNNTSRSTYCRQRFEELTRYTRDYAQAEEQARIYLKDPARRLKLARLMVQGKEYAKGINQYQMCLKLDPKNAAARKELETLTQKLKASGEMPAMETFQGMMIALTSSRGRKAQ